MDKVVSTGHEQLITVDCCFSVSGAYVPPAMLVSQKRMCHEAPIGTLILTSDTGYMDTDFFMQWLHHFQNNIKEWKLTHCQLCLTVIFQIIAWNESFSAHRTA